METMGMRIRASREKCGFSQNELARSIGVKSGAVISNWENDINKPDAEKIIALCKALDIAASFLLDYYGKSEHDLSTCEHTLIKKYRNLDGYGRNTVEMVLESEHMRCLGAPIK